MTGQGEHSTPPNKFPGVHVEMWKQLVGWGRETIKSMQRQALLTDDPILVGANEDGPNEAGREDESRASIRSNQGAVQPGRPGWTREGFSQDAAPKERAALSKKLNTTHDLRVKLGEDLAAARAGGHENDSPVEGALTAKLHDLRDLAQQHEQRWTYVDGKIVVPGGSFKIPEGYFNMHTEAFRFPGSSDTTQGQILSQSPTDATRFG